jgi:diguanylate cyclase (GGDEF)-like protein/PAS domain S-box-containing protein
LAQTVIALRRNQGFEATLEATHKGGGQRLMNEFLSVVEGARSDELGLLATRDAAARRASTHARINLILGTVLGLIITAGAGWSVLRDQLGREQAEEDLYAEKERAQVTLNSIADAVASTDIRGSLTYVNPVAEKMSGWRMGEAAGRPMFEVFQILDGDSYKPVPNPMAMAIAQNASVRLPPNSILVSRDGSEIPIEDSAAPIHNRKGEAIGAVIAFRDVTIARTFSRQLAHAAEHDFLTGLPNRMLLNDRIDQAIAAARRHMKLVSVLFLDLDGFKQINDSLGHLIGDKLLRSVAKRLVNCVRASDTVSRLGGDEFVVLLSEVQQLEDATVTARRILAAVAQVHSIDQHELYVTVSIGVSVYPDDGLDAVTLIKNADAAMYRAKKNGRQSFQFFQPVDAGVVPKLTSSSDV